VRFEIEHWRRLALHASSSAAPDVKIREVTGVMAVAVLHSARASAAFG
jgi:hypothetical protein